MLPTESVMVAIIMRKNEMAVSVRIRNREAISEDVKKHERRFT